MWNDIFSVGVPVLEKIIRPIIVYFFLVILLRAFGKRELAQLNPFDLVVLLSLSNTVQNAIIGNDNSLSGGLIGAFTLLAVNYLVVRFLFRHRRLDQLLKASRPRWWSMASSSRERSPKSCSPAPSWRPCSIARVSTVSKMWSAACLNRAACSTSIGNRRRPMRCSTPRRSPN
jgi:hypothetical protein